ncbi:MAG: hypothetical protein FWF85_02735 [Clostridiales bacterium]|nr:hypothetical protein [Clostridiales bacterium]
MKKGKLIILCVLLALLVVGLVAGGSIVYSTNNNKDKTIENQKKSLAKKEDTIKSLNSTIYNLINKMEEIPDKSVLDEKVDNQLLGKFYPLSPDSIQGESSYLELLPNNKFIANYNMCDRWEKVTGKFFVRDYTFTLDNPDYKVTLLMLVADEKTGFYSRFDMYRIINNNRLRFLTPNEYSAGGILPDNPDMSFDCGENGIILAK